ncbi:MAG: DUF502 domain-containing protein [Betaproteobacteria bacterium]|jgi:uncharacterized membrane protein|nr:DUF502 domain-containing protein [Pseudomonadota bacterium]NBO02878.1 DUF502 domain-containing protein [Betaproteobacteria bacterium]HAB47308.1 hypothetical protein [Lautropia sp.]NBO95099.1 DUF502 domain-containing protein [Betaproteobacteria bacterium]NBP35341.1 DUF502 domain-containing protein [Betaproteobacteria bacterium]
MLKKYFIAGLLVWLPLIITIWIIELVVGTLDRTIDLLPPQLQPQGLFGFSIYGAGAVFALAIILLTGLLAANFLGARIVRVWESLLNRIPVVRSIYAAVKQVSDTVFADNGQAFRKALLVQYPRMGVWTIAFQTGRPSAELESHLHDNMISVYVPTTPNPTSGFFLVMDRHEVIELEMSVDDALKYVVSMGVVAPTNWTAQEVAVEQR